MKLARITTLTLLSCAALFPASGVQAAISAPGTSCESAHPVFRANGFYYRQSGIEKVSYHSDWVVCPLPAEKSIGETAEFDIQVRTSYVDESVQCIGSVFDAAGDLIATTPTVTATGSVGTRRISTEVVVGSTSTTTYSLSCYLSGDILAIRVH